MKIQKENGRILDLPESLANRLIAKGKFKYAEELEEEDEPKEKRKRNKKKK